jgi:hypothetical protein
LFTFGEVIYVVTTTFPATPQKGVTRKVAHLAFGEHRLVAVKEQELKEGSEVCKAHERSETTPRGGLSHVTGPNDLGQTFAASEI